MATPPGLPGTRFVDGLRVTPAHLNHLQAVAAAAADDLRRVVGLGRVGAGLRIDVDDDGAVVLSPGVGFTSGGAVVRRDEPTAIPLPDDEARLMVGLRAVTLEDESTRVGTGRRSSPAPPRSSPAPTSATPTTCSRSAASGGRAAA